MSTSNNALFLKHVIVESCVLGGIGILLTALRLYLQISFNGVRGIHWDDKLMIVASMCLVSMLVFNTLTVIASNAALIDVGSSITYLSSPNTTSGDVPLSAVQRKNIVLAAKYIVVGEESYEATVYLVKACLLIYYNRFTSNLRQNRAVKALTAYVVACFVATQITFFAGICRPFSGQWALPPPSGQCVTWFNFTIVQGVFNMSSDLLMILIPLPILISSNLPAKQKWSWIAVFGLGIFAITCALLNKLFYLLDPYNTSWIFWTMRELNVSVYAANLIRIFPHILQKARGFTHSTYYNNPTIEKTLVPSKRNNRKLSIFSSENTDFETKISNLSKGGSVLGRTTLASYRVSGGDRESFGQQNSSDIEAACIRELPRSILHLAPKRSLEVSPRTSADRVIIPRVLVRDDVRANRRSNGLFCDDYELR